MIKNYFTQQVERHGKWRVTHILLGAGVTLLVLGAIAQIAFPVSSGIDGIDKPVAMEGHGAKAVETKLLRDPNAIKINYRAGFFKSAAGLQDNPIANKTIERIKNQLKLRCIMEISGRAVAYIDIQGIGMKKCSVGDNINDLFTVLDINKSSKAVDISIVDHKITLYP